MRKKILWALAIFFVVSFIYADWYYNPQTGTIDYYEPVSGANFGDLANVTLTGMANGNILYYNGTRWINLAAGAAAEVMTVSGAGIPSWAAAGAPGAHAATHELLGADLVDHDNLTNYVAGQHTDLANVFYISATGGDYATIQAALTAQNAGGEVFIVGPGTYAADTINFSANDQTVRGYGLTPNVHVTQADAIVCNFGAHTGCRIENMHLEMTAPTTAKDLITGTGSLRIRWCHLEMTNAAVATADQPTCLDTTGNVIMTFGTVEYANTGNDGGGATAIKAAIRISGSADVEFRRVRFIITGAGQSLAITPAYGTAGVVTMVRCLITVDDDVSSNTIGFAYSNIAGGVHEFMGNDIHVDNATNAAVGIWVISSEEVRSMFNHIHVTSAGGTADSFNIGASATITSQFDDIIAANGTAGGGTLVIVSSQADGDLTLSGDFSSADIHHSDFISTEYYSCGNSGASITIDWNNGNLQYVTLTAVGVDMTFTEPPNPGDCKLWIIQDGTGDRTIDWTHEITPEWPGGVAPTLSTGAADVDVIVFTFIGGTTYRGLFNGDFS